MKTLEFKQQGLTELTFKEAIEITGGEKRGFWWWVGTIAGLLAVGFGLAAAIEDYNK